MIKFSKKNMFGIAVLIIVLLILSRIYINNQISTSDSLLTDYSKRQQDLISKQQQLQNMIVDLNSTLQNAVKNQQNLSDQLVAITGQPISTTKKSTGGSSSSSSSSSSPPPVVTPPPAPSPPPVTRAS